MSNTLVGYPPGGAKPHIVAINVPADMKAELTKRYQDQGYTGLTWGKAIRKEDDTDDSRRTGEGS